MKKYFSTIKNPEYQDFSTYGFYGFSKQLRKKSLNKKSKENLSQDSKTISKSDIRLPSIDFHVPSYQFVNNAKKKKKEAALSTPKLPDKQLIDFTMRNVKSKNEKYDILSSKVDFFSTRNQKRLDIQKRKVFVDLGMLKVQKAGIYTNPKNSSGPSVQIMKLLSKYVTNKQKLQQNQGCFVVVGKEIDQNKQCDQEIDI